MYQHEWISSLFVLLFFSLLLRDDNYYGNSVLIMISEEQAGSITKAWIYLSCDHVTTEPPFKRPSVGAAHEPTMNWQDYTVILGLKCCHVIYIGCQVD